MSFLERVMTSRIVLLAAWMMFSGPPLLAQSSEGDPIAALRHEIAELRHDYEARLKALEARLAELEAAAPGDELARLREAARQVAPPSPPAAPDASGGRQRSLNRLNPEISYTFNLLGVAADDSREEFVPQEFELDLRGALDPYSRGRFTLALGEEGELEIEEGYLAYSSLPSGLELIAGRFRQTFGTLNRQHLHALPQSGYPLVVTTFLGEEGLAQTGLSFNWLLPRPWAGANEITLQVTDGESEIFGGEAFEHLAVLGHLKNYWDLSEAAYFEWGLSGVVGENAAGGSNRVWGTDFTYHWQPPRRAKFRDLTWRTEILLSQRGDALARRQEAWGGYSYLEGLVRQNLYLGARVDRVEDPLDPARRSWGFVPYLTWWQSEFVRLRAEFQRREENLSDETVNRFVVQLTWAAGPHKHETY